MLPDMAINKTYTKIYTRGDVNNIILSLLWCLEFPYHNGYGPSVHYTTNIENLCPDKRLKYMLIVALKL